MILSSLIKIFALYFTNFFSQNIENIIYYLLIIFNLVIFLISLRESEKGLTDSQNKNEYTTYATTLVFHIGNTGCHVVYKKNRVKRIPIEDYYSRLWGEVERSVEVALYLRNNGIEVSHVGLDLNSDPKRKSHRLVSSARG